MKFEDLKLLSIGGGCLALYLLGKDRLQGPVDNVLIKTDKAIKLLLDNQYLAYIKSNKKKKILKGHDYKDWQDVPYLYNYEDNLIIIHNDPTTEKYLKNLNIRLKNFNAFYKKVKIDPEYYFIFTVPYSMIGHNTHEQIDNRLEKLILLFKKYNLLDKVVFITSKAPDALERAWYNIWPKESVIQNLQKKYNINYVSLTDLNLETAAGLKKAQEQFKKKITKLLAPIVDKKKEKQYYLYF